MSLAYSIGTAANPYTYWYNFIVTSDPGFTITGCPSNAKILSRSALRTSAQNLVISMYSSGTYSQSVTGTGVDGETVNLSISKTMTGGCGYTSSSSSKPIDLEIVSVPTGYKAGFLVSQTQTGLGSKWTGATWTEGTEISVPIGSGSNQACMVIPLCYEKTKYEITVTAGTEGGKVSGGGTYYEGDTATLTATASTSEGYEFEKWSDGNTSATRTVVVKAAATYTASFKLKTYTISYNKGSYGSGTNTSDTKTYDVALTLPGIAFTRTDYLQSGWSTSDAGASNDYDLGGSYTANADATLYPYWTYTTHTLTLASNDTTLGTVSGGGTYGHNRTATATATVNARIATFTKWSDDTTAATKSVTMDADKSFTATFTAKSVSTTYGVQNSSGMGGYVAIGDSGTHVTGTSTTSATYCETKKFVTGCDAGYKFKRWAVYYKALSAAGVVSGDEQVVYPGWASTFTWTSGPVDVSETTVTTSPTGAYQITKIMAEFEAQTYAVTASAAKTSSTFGRWDTSVTPGSVSGTGSFGYKTNCTLEATAASNYSFARWDDDSTANPRTFQVLGNTDRVAYFTGVAKTLTLVATSTGRGTIAFSDGGGANREYGTVAKIKATPAAHYKFTKWTDGSTDSERTVNVSADASFQAQFVANDSVEIKTGVTPSGGGTVSGGGTKTYDTAVTLTATPSANWEFVSWQDGVTTATRTLNADETTAAVTYTATFRKLAYAVSASGTNCTVAETVVSGTERSTGVYEYGTVLNLSVTPTEHYHFTQWSDGDTSNPRQVTVTAAASYAATAVIDTHTVTAVSESTAKGTVSATLVSGSGSAGVYSYGSVLELTATPGEQYQFDQWTDGVTTATRRVTVSADATYTARFKVMTYTVTVSAGAGGSVSIVGKTGLSETFNYGDGVSISATPAEHYSFSKWSDDTTANPKSFTVTGNHTYAASFAVDRFAITATAGTGGTVTGGGQYDYGSRATLEATATWTSADHYRLVGWYDSADNLVATTATFQPTVTGAASYTAKFEKVKHSVSVSVTGDGSASGAGDYEYNSTATLTATAGAHSRFVKWTSGGSDYSTSATITPTVTGDVSFTAVFALDTHVITTGVVDSGTGTVTAGGTYSYGDEVTLVATPTANYHFVEWYKDGTATGIKTSVLNFVVEETAEYKAKFIIGEYMISATVTPVGCGASVSGTGKYNEGETTTLTAVDAGQYTFDKWSDGVTTRSRTAQVTAAASFTAQFKLKRYTLTVNSNDSAKGDVTGGGTFDYTASETLKITASPKDHCHFTGWKRNGGSEIVSTDAVLYVSLSANTVYTAQFAADTYTVATAAVGPGTVSGAGTYGYGTSISLVASAESGYAFTAWSDGSTANPRTHVVTGNASFTASFVKQATERGRVFSARHAALFW